MGRDDSPSSVNIAIGRAVSHDDWRGTRPRVPKVKVSLSNLQTPASIGRLHPSQFPIPCIYDKAQALLDRQGRRPGRPDCKKWGSLMDRASLQDRYDGLKAEATLLSGGLLDISRRALVLYGMYLDSGRNHNFSLIAAHGALWASGYFEAGGSLGRLIARRYFYNPEERAYRLGLLRQFAEDFRKVNRQVCIDTYANYHFARRFGREPGAEGLIAPSLLDALNRVHAAREGKRALSPEESRRAFEQSFRCEQEVTVAPGVRAAVRSFECKVMRFLCLRPLVRFAYFPAFRYLWFRDFADQDERIDRGMKAYDLAARVGWPGVERSLRYYGVMPTQLLDEPERSLAEIREELARQGARAAAVFGRAEGPSGVA
jgi:hypothetical protein